MKEMAKSPFKMGEVKGKSIPASLILSLIIMISTPAQDNDYWANAPKGNTNGNLYKYS